MGAHVSAQQGVSRGRPVANLPKVANLPNVPLPIAIAAGVVTAVTWLMTLVGGQVTGVSWDEPYRVGKLANLLQQGWFVDDLVDGQPADFNTYVYAPVYDLASHAFATVLGNGAWSQPSVTPEAYAARHLSLAVLAIIGMAAVGLLTSLLLGNWRWGLVATAVLGSVGLWTGHAMFNSSDLPVAVGYTIVTLAVVLIARNGAGAGSGVPGRLGTALVGWRADLAWGALLAAGATLAIGSRPATWPAIVVSLVLAVAGATLVAPGPAASRRSAAIHAGASAIGALAVTFVILALVYPKAFANPLTALVNSIGQSAKFGGQESVDSTVTLASALGYLPSWLRLQLPIGITLLALAGIGLAVLLIVRAIRTREGDSGWRAVGLVALGAQLLVLPLGAALAHSNVYDGVRQFLFIIPAIAILATLGIAALLLLAARPPSAKPVWATAAWVLVGASILLPIVDQGRLFPYNYAYANETASPLNDRLPTDYWRTSMRELVPLVPAEGATACNFDPLILGLVPIDCANAGQVAPYLDARGTAALPVTVPPGKYLYLASNRGLSAPPPQSGCSIVDRVTRTLRGEEVVMSYVALCEAPCVVQEAASCAGKSLVGANLDGWNLRGSDFSGADFTGASLVLVDLTGANLTGANLTGVNLEQADLTDARLDGVVATGLIGSPKALPRGYRIKDGALVRKGKASS